MSKRAGPFALAERLIACESWCEASPFRGSPVVRIMGKEMKKMK